MMSFVLCILFVLLGISLMLTTVLFVQVIAATLFKPRRLEEVKLEAASVVVLIPAHNEALGIANTLHSILPQLRKQDRLLVVADNCQDDTADIARALGGEVVERHDLSQRGKGYALDFGLKHLLVDPPEIVIIVDADCVLAPDAVKNLTHKCIEKQRPVQALYLMKNAPQASIKARISEFAWVVRNQIRPLGMHVLGLPCQLMGTGMAFLWKDLMKINLATGHIVEDMKLGLDFAYLHSPPIFLPDTLVASQFPNESNAGETQRTRWEHGHLSVILSEVPRLLFRAISTQNLQLLMMALDLMIPPLALFTTICLVVSIVSFAIFFKQPDIWLIVLPLTLLGTLFLVVGLAWVGFARNIISLKELAQIPLYILRKIPIYFKFLIHRQVEWVRSKRD